jgi:hypothetical protein
LNVEHAMKFLCLICADTLMEHMTEGAAEQHYLDYQAFTDEIRRSGHLVDCNRLTLPEMATTVRVRDGTVSTTDGPYAETKEHCGGYYVIEAKDRDEAIRIAARIPGAWHGCVELRPIAEDRRTRDALGRSATTGRSE